jgi:hypothetical protein
VDSEADRRRWAERIWAESRALTRGDPVTVYLGGRGIDLDALAERNGRRLPASLRYHPRLKNDESNKFWPAMVAAVRRSSGELSGVHRTWLAPGGAGKAPLEAPKKTLGLVRGGAIRLWGPPWRLAAPGAWIGIAEGVEDAVTGVLLPPAIPGLDVASWRVCAASSVSLLASIVLPAAFERVVMIAQNDAPDSRASIAFEAARRRFRGQGRQVFIYRPARRSIKDLNDYLREVRYG